MLPRRQWADYFDKQGVTYAFFSAANAAALQQARRFVEEIADIGQEEDESRDTYEDNDESSDEGHGNDFKHETDMSGSDLTEERDQTVYFSAGEDDLEEDRIRVLTVLELEELFIKTAPEPLCTSFHVYFSPQFNWNVVSAGDRPTKLTVGLVGYPNVGKSSTINSLLGEKKVSVSATPGKTKHFQTIHLSPNLVLCDCPGLVFPQFAVQRAELVCDGVLPVDQLREYHGPVALVAKWIGREVLEGTYGLTIRRRGEETGIENNEVTAEDLLVAYASTSHFPSLLFLQFLTGRLEQSPADSYAQARAILMNPVLHDIFLRISLTRSCCSVIRLPESRRKSSMPQQSRMRYGGSSTRGKRKRQ